MTSARFEIVRTDAVQPWHARFRAANGRIVWTTENYRRRNAAHDALFHFGRFMYADSTPWPLALLTQRYGSIEVRYVDERGKP